MKVSVQCLDCHVDEVSLILARQNCIFVQRGKGFGRTESSFEGRSSLPDDIFEALLENTVSDRCKDPIKVIISPA
jgi:hypothetical protein